MNNNYTHWEIQKFDPIGKKWNVLDVCFTEGGAKKEAPFYAKKYGEVRIVKHEEHTTIIGTIKYHRNNKEGGET